MRRNSILSLGLVSAWTLAAVPTETPTETRATKKRVPTKARAMKKRIQGSNLGPKEAKLEERAALERSLHPFTEPKREDYPTRQLYRQARRNWLQCK